MAAITYNEKRTNFFVEWKGNDFRIVETTPQKEVTLGCMEKLRALWATFLWE